MARTIVVYLPVGYLHRHVDVSRLRMIHPDVELLTVPWEIDSEERLARTRDPFDSRLPLAETPLSPEQADAFQRAEVVFTLDVPLDVASHAPQLRWVQALGSGVAQYRSARLDEGGVVLTNAAGVGSIPIAEWVIGRVLQMLKRFPEHDEHAARQTWQSAPGRLLDGKTMAIVGLGAIGRALAVRSRALGVHVIGLRRSAVTGAVDPDVDELAPADALHDVLSRSDIAVLSAAGTQSNRDLFDHAAFSAMRDGSWFVNVSRGDLVVEGALVDALGSGRLAGAAIDVARKEPLPPDDPLWQAPNLLISPHSSAAGEGYARRVSDLFLRNFERYVTGRPLLNVVDLSAI